MNAPKQIHRIGILGCGNIFPRYVTGLARYPELTIVRVADTDPARAEQAATEFRIPAWGNDIALYDDDTVEVLVNLTPPSQHALTTIRALQAGKHVYVEKPLAVTLADGRAVVATAASNRRLVGSAPDTFLGSASQTARQAVDSGMIGEPVGATAFVRHTKAETWHPDPTFLFQAGGGPVLDMGPYYLTALVNPLGPVRSVAAANRMGAPKRAVTSPGRLVEVIEVQTNTHASALLEFESGPIGSALFSFEIWDTELPRIEIYGTEGTLSLPNPNNFDGHVRLKRHTDVDWLVLEPVTPLFGAVDTPEQYRRGLGVRDLLNAVEGGKQRASAELALHVLEVLTSIDAASSDPTVIHMATHCERPATVEPTRNEF
jgi:predicted dehydrogenase